MERELADSRRQNIIGNRKLSSNHQVVTEAFKLWRRRLSYYSLFAALPILSLNAQDATVDAPQKSEAELAGTATRLLEGRNKRNPNEPELLRRHSNYRLPHQRNKYDVVSEFTGGDDWPGNPIPKGFYTSAAPFADSGDTTNANDTVHSIGIPYWSYYQTNGRDLIYSFTLLGRGANPSIEVSTTSGAYRPLIYFLTDASKSFYGPIEAPATGGTAAASLQGIPINVRHYLFIDAKFSSSFGPYSLRMQDVVVADKPRRNFDFDGDGRSDLAVWRPNEGKWYLRQFSTGIRTVSWGLDGDVVVPGDYDLDGKTDSGVWRPSEGNWYIVNSSDGSLRVQQWGLPGDIPVPGDFDLDGKYDLAVFRPSEGKWYVFASSGNISETAFGAAGDVPIQGNFFSDSIPDIAIYRNGQWFIRKIATGHVTLHNWGLPGDVAVPADYDGDGSLDITVWRPANGTWYIRKSGSSEMEIEIRQWGLNGDTPVPADYDGDGKADLAVYRNGTWYLRQSTNGISVQQWGLAGDVPVPSPFVP